MGLDAVEELRTSEAVLPFLDLPRSVRRSVRLLAMEGELHPDRAIAVSSLVYALRSRTRLGRMTTLMSLSVGILVVVPGVGPGGGDTAVLALKNRRMITKLAALADRNGWQLAGHGIGVNNGNRYAVSELATKHGLLLSADSPAKRALRRHGGR